MNAMHSLTGANNHSRRNSNSKGKRDRTPNQARAKVDLAHQVLVLAASDHVVGQGAAQALIAATRLPGSSKPAPCSIFGGLHIQLHSIPSQESDIQKLMTGIVSSHMKVQPVTYVTRVTAVNPDFQRHTEWSL